jgi:hypothetical protein
MDVEVVPVSFESHPQASDPLIPKTRPASLFGKSSQSAIHAIRDRNEYMRKGTVITGMRRGVHGGGLFWKVDDR